MHNRKRSEYLWMIGLSVLTIFIQLVAYSLILSPGALSTWLATADISSLIAQAMTVIVGGGSIAIGYSSRRAWPAPLLQILFYGGGAFILKSISPLIADLLLPYIVGIAAIFGWIGSQLARHNDILSSRESRR